MRLMGMRSFLLNIVRKYKGNLLIKRQEEGIEKYDSIHMNRNKKFFL